MGSLCGLGRVWVGGRRVLRRGGWSLMGIGVIAHVFRWGEGSRRSVIPARTPECEWRRKARRDKRNPQTLLRTPESKLMDRVDVDGV